MRRNLVVRTGDGLTPLAVVDAKYKLEKTDGLHNTDLHQALAYATVLDLREAHLVYGLKRSGKHQAVAPAPGGRRATVVA